MSTRRKLALATLVAAPLLVGGFVAQERDTRDGARLLDQVLTIVSGRFVDSVDAAALYEKAARGLVHELNDPYSVLLSPKELATFTAQTGGKYGGVGMEIAEVQGFVTVQRIFPNTPAEQAGVIEGDRIVRVDTADTRGWTTAQVSDVLKGRPGSKVNVKFMRAGVVEPIAVTFTRANVRIPAVPYAIMLDGKVGYIPLQQFNETATDELQAAIRRLSGEGARGLVLDLRGNGGGYLEQSATVANLFLSKGMEISRVRGRAGYQEVLHATDNPIAPDIPLVILTDGRTASASEIVAGALQDHDRAVIVGTTSFGKGLVQTVYPLEGGYALKMTTAKWYTPSGRSIQKDRKLLPDGSFVEVLPDSMETDSVRRSRPKFKSDAGRTVYGGGAVTPDVIVQPDTLTTDEQKLLAALAPKAQIVRSTLVNYAVEHKGKVQPGFAVLRAWRDEFYTRLVAQGVKIDRAQYEAGGSEIDRLLGSSIARIAFGDSTAKRRDVAEDAQLRRSVDLLRQGPTQRDLFAAVLSQTPPASRQ
ncbi:MAG: S41 family peptidase [Gemmatimonadaceae bacterium]|nr:S41 family peptidase [Gemmatimonadaceae bacterium]MDQ3244556.1 S41 family peptidase [Gemmatimonadota bacterium]